MAESITHIRLVEEMVHWIAKAYLNGDKGFLLIDHPDFSSGNKPPKINGYVPDVFTAKTPSNLIIIGEAKTIYDVERPHSEEQIKAFLKYCMNYEKSVFVVAAPWQMSRFVKTFIKRLQDQTGSSMVRVNVIEGLFG